MNALVVASVVFACLLGGTALGMILRRLLPADHLSQEAKDVIKLGTGLIATMAALVLGLLTASAKSSFDGQASAVKQTAAELIMLDRTLARYGPEAAPLRAELRAGIEERVRAIWPADRSAPAQLEPKSKPFAERFIGELRKLAPASDEQREAQAQAVKIADQILQTRWLLFTQAASSAIPLPFLVVVVLWLTVIFGSFAILAAPNPTVAVALGLSALSVSGALFLILEMDSPFEGLLRISPAPLEYALKEMGKPAS
jgi:Protein of unknown function (DUF4239)